MTYQMVNMVNVDSKCYSKDHGGFRDYSNIKHAKTTIKSREKFKF